MIEASCQVNVKINKLSSAGPSVNALLSAIVRKSCFDIEAKAKEGAAVDTGAMKASIYSVTDGKDESTDAQSAAAAANPKSVFLSKPGLPVNEVNGFVAVGAEYAAFVEYGTTRAAAQPFFNPAVDAVRPAFESACRQVTRAITGAPSKDTL